MSTPGEEYNAKLNTTASHNQAEFSLFLPSVPQMYRGRVFIGDGSPTTFCYYTIMPPNNYIPGIFQGSTVFLHHSIDYILASTAHWAQRHTSSFGEFGLRGVRRARSPTPFFAAPRMAPPSPLVESPCYLRLRRWCLGLRLSSLAFVFAVGALVFASLRLPSSSLKSLGRQKTLSLDPNGLRAFG